MHRIIFKLNIFGTSFRLERNGMGKRKSIISKSESADWQKRLKNQISIGLSNLLFAVVAFFFLLEVVWTRFNAPFDQKTCVDFRSFTFYAFLFYCAPSLLICLMHILIVFITTINKLNSYLKFNFVRNSKQWMRERKK